MKSTGRLARACRRSSYKILQVGEESLTILKTLHISLSHPHDAMLWLPAAVKLPGSCASNANMIFGRPCHQVMEAHDMTELMHAGWA